MARIRVSMCRCVLVAPVWSFLCPCPGSRMVDEKEHRIRLLKLEKTYAGTSHSKKPGANITEINLTFHSSCVFLGRHLMTFLVMAEFQLGHIQPTRNLQ